MRLTSAITATLLCAISSLVLHAQEQSQVEINQNPAGWAMDWDGTIGRTYFMQYSTDLVDWSFFPTIRSGDGSVISLGFNSTSDKFFTRLKYTDESDGGDPYTHDFDADGLDSITELASQYQTDPLNPDTDGDFLMDGWEMAYGYIPNNEDSDGNGINDGLEDPDGDGANNMAEQANGGDPNDPLDGGLAPLLVFGNGEAGVEVPGERTYTIPAGLGNCLVVAYVYSEEYVGGFTAYQSEFDDTLSWDVNPSNANAITGSISVNTLHNQWVQSEANGTSFMGYSPIALKVLGVVDSSSTQSVTVDVEVGVTNIEDGDYPTTVMVKFIPVSISPDEGQAGTNGDVVPSNQGADGEKHYVTPKKTDEINDDFVILKVEGIDADSFGETLQWEFSQNGGEQVPGDPLKCRIPRAAADKFTAKIKLKDGNQDEVDMMNVWVVWAETAITQSLVEPQFGAGIYSGIGGFDPARAWQFKFSIMPVELFADQAAVDVPMLSGAAETNAPGHNQPYFYTAHLNLANEPGDTAPLKWDVSRRVEIQTLNNPSGNQVPAEKFLPDYSFLKEGQPVAQSTPIQYPLHPAQGNDDPLTRDNIPVVDEDSNPYMANAQGNGLDHGIGEITSFDAPIFSAFVDSPDSGVFMAQIANFKEFARLEIKGKYANQENSKYWYRISEYINWHHVWAAQYGESPPNSNYFTWINNGSSSGNNVFVLPNE